MRLKKGQGMESLAGCGAEPRGFKRDIPAKISNVCV